MERATAERELTSLIGRALRSIPYVKLDRVDEVTESFKQALALLEASCDLTAEERAQFEQLRRADFTEPAPEPGHQPGLSGRATTSSMRVPFKPDPADSDDEDEDDDDRKESQSQQQPRANGNSGVNAAVTLLSSLRSSDEAASSLPVGAPSRPFVTKEIGNEASPRGSTRAIGAKKPAGMSSRAGGDAPKGLLGDDDEPTRGPGGAASAAAAAPVIRQVPPAPGRKVGSDGSPMMTPRSLGRKVAEKQAAANSLIGDLPQRAAQPKASSRAGGSSVKRPDSPAQASEDEEDTDDDSKMDVRGEGEGESKAESKGSSHSAMVSAAELSPRLQQKKRQRSDVLPDGVPSFLPVVASPKHHAISRGLLAAAAKTESTAIEFHTQLPEEAAQILGPAARPLPMPAGAVPGTLAFEQAGTTPKAPFLRRLDSPATHHGKLLAAKGRLSALVKHSIRLVPKMRPAANIDAVRAAFLTAISKLEAATVEAQ